MLEDTIVPPPTRTDIVPDTNGLTGQILTPEDLVPHHRFIQSPSRDLTLRANKGANFLQIQLASDSSSQFESVRNAPPFLLHFPEAGVHSDHDSRAQVTIRRIHVRSRNYTLS